MKNIFIAMGLSLAAAGCAVPTISTELSASGFGYRADRGTGSNIPRKDRDAYAEGVRGMDVADVERLQRGGSAPLPGNKN